MDFDCWLCPGVHGAREYQVPAADLNFYPTVYLCAQHSATIEIEKKSLLSLTESKARKKRILAGEYRSREIGKLPDRTFATGSMIAGPSSLTLVCERCGNGTLAQRTQYGTLCHECLFGEHWKRKGESNVKA